MLSDAPVSPTHTFRRKSVDRFDDQMLRSSGRSASCTTWTFRGSPCGPATWSHTLKSPAIDSLAALRALSQLDADVQVEALEYIAQLAHKDRDRRG
jgi:hypothetical protein